MSEYEQYSWRSIHFIARYCTFSNLSMSRCNLGAHITEQCSNWLHTIAKHKDRLHLLLVTK